MEPVVRRLVIMLAGPTGAGKSTWAREHDLEVISWESSGRNAWDFWDACAAVAEDERARTVVERTAPQRRLREVIAAACRADRIYVMTPNLEDVIARILHRDRPGRWHEIDAAAAWYDEYEPDHRHGPPPDQLPW